MSGSSIPYRLRPNKFIDREIFVDLINHLVPQRGASKYVYISMGGQHLVDHSVVYRRAGISNLYSFDFEEEVVLRQNFNKPIDTVYCEAIKSEQLAGRLDEIMARFEGSENVIVWLDYTSPSERLEQLQEVEAVAKRLQPGDILRATFNTNIGSLDEGGNSAAWKEAGSSGPGEYRCERLRTQIGEYLPTEMKEVGDSEFPAAMSEATSIALSKASLESAAGLVFRPVLLTTYKDGQRMTTATVIVDNDEHPFRSDSQTWQFLPSGWTDILEISAPDLSTREKFRIDQELSNSSHQIHAAFGFPLSENAAKSIRAIESYKKLRRYYPAFQHTEA
ncbi:O-methyltransferase [Ruegeria denitrificans]|uniref:O-methyltransferase n=1 Tax=Ruegeria denitrificans TaxID=1715692 RepID=UPI003C7DE8A2